ncbi:MAG: ATP-binding cassette domain-containing protein [Firmicutes bacterium]|nr:ATP-binding cassette domain-containing protein [Bacillota bacterium]
MSLIVSDLYKKYGEKTVVDHLSFEMREPGVYALLGTNGAGKTTSIRMMLGMLAKDGGQVFWKGAPLSTETCNVGYLAEERGLYPKYTLMDQLLYFAGLRGVSKAEAKERIRYWAQRLEAEEYLYAPADLSVIQNDNAETQTEDNGEGKQKKVKNWSKKKAWKPKQADQLSKGNQQKIQFMIALISNPELLILDEPLSGLDPVNTDLFKGIIREEIGKGKYLIMSSHQMATVEEFCTDITIMDRSKAVLQGNLNEIKKSYGRVNLHLKTERDAARHIAAAGATILTMKENEYQIKVSGEEQANALLASLITAGVPVITFDLREPSLHEIFVEKVGESHE